MRVQAFTWPGVSELLYRNPYIVVVLTYGTILFEIVFPFLLFNRWSRWIAVVAGIVFHTGIALFMGLVTFSWSVLSLYPFLLTDREYEWMTTRARRAWQAGAMLVAR